MSPHVYLHTRNKKKEEKKFMLLKPRKKVKNISFKYMERERDVGLCVVFCVMVWGRVRGGSVAFSIIINYYYYSCFMYMQMIYIIYLYELSIYMYDVPIYVL